MINNDKDIKEQLLKICELAVLDIKYDAVITMENIDNGLLKLGKEKKWLFTTYDVRLGIDVNKVSIDYNDNKINIKVPDVEIIGQISRSENKEYKIFQSKKSKFLRRTITIDDENKSIAETKEKIKNEIMEMNEIKECAKNRAKALIENMITFSTDLSNQQVNFVA